MAKEIIYIKPLNNSYWECKEPLGIVNRYIQLYIGGKGVSRCSFDNRQEWLEGIETVKSMASIVNSYPYKSEPLSFDEKKLFDTPKIQNILLSLSGWQLFIKKKYPHLDLQSVHEWPGIRHMVEFSGKKIICSNSFLVFDSKYLEIHGLNQETSELELYSDTLSNIELNLIRKFIRADLLNRLDSISRFLKVSFNWSSTISDYMKGGFLK